MTIKLKLKFMITDIESRLKTLAQEAQEAIASSESLSQLEELRVSYLGKKRSIIPHFKRNG